MRFVPTTVTCDLAVWPTFGFYPVCGEDRHHNNPVGSVPTGDQRPVRYLQSASEFS